jgi:NAD(P)-dependent dehydrogenase (short-subunit alcohol dehydrogenase family)
VLTTEERAEQAVRTTTGTSSPSETPGNVKFLHLDLNDLTSVKKAATTFAQQESKLDVLWNNAGASGHALEPGVRTGQDFEPMIGTHCVATLLTQLLPQLRAAVAAGTPSSVRVYGHPAS